MIQWSSDSVDTDVASNWLMIFTDSLHTHPRIITIMLNHQINLPQNLFCNHALTSPGITVKLHEVVDLSLSWEEDTGLGWSGDSSQSNLVSGGSSGNTVNIDGLHCSQLQVSGDDLPRQPQSVSSLLQVTILLTRRPEEDVFVTELLLQELSELAQTNLVGQQNIKLLAPASSSPCWLKILLKIDIINIILTRQTQTIQTLRVSDADLNIVLIHEPLEIIKPSSLPRSSSVYSVNSPVKLEMRRTGLVWRKCKHNIWQ